MWLSFIIYVFVNPGICSTDFTDAVEENCQCTTELFQVNINENEIKSPNFPHRYCNNLDCEWRVLPAANKGISLAIESFSTEQKHDFLQIDEIVPVNGSFTYVNRAFLSGFYYALPFTTFFTAKGNGFRLRFASDSTYSTRMGFRATFTRHDNENAFCPPVLHQANETMQSLPSILPSFAARSGCVFQLMTAEGFTIEITPLRMHTSMSLKYYEIPMRTDRNNDDKYRQTQTAGLMSKTTSHTNILLVQVTQPYSTLWYKKYEYEIGYKSVVSPCLCFSKTITLSDDIAMVNVTSPGYPNTYCPNLNCTSTVSTSAVGNSTHIPVIQYHVNEMETEIEGDSLSIQTTEGVLLVSMSGTVSSEPVTVALPQTILSFVTDGTVNYNGFQMTLKLLYVEKGCTCPEGTYKVIDDQHGEVSALIPSHCGFLDCWWRLKVHQEDFLRIHLTSNFSESEHILFQNMVNSMQYSESPLNPYTHEFDDETKLEMGVRYHREQPGQDTFFNFTYQWKDHCECGPTTLKATPNKWAELSSPNYPSRYCNNVLCVYRLLAPEGYRIVVNVTDFRTEQYHDYVTFRDGTAYQDSYSSGNTSLKLIEIATGSVLYDRLIYSTNESMTVIFQSDLSVTAEGFRLIFTADKLPDSVSGSSTSLLLICVVLLVFTTTMAIALYFKKRPLFSFRNPAYSATVEYVNDEIVDTRNPAYSHHQIC